VPNLVIVLSTVLVLWHGQTDRQTDTHTHTPLIVVVSSQMIVIFKSGLKAVKHYYEDRWVD